MADAFEVIDLGAVNQELRIEVDAGVGCMGSDSEPDTDFYVKPPLTETEHSTLIEQLGPESKVGELLVAGTEKEGEWLKLTADGEPSQEHVDLGIELAKEIITLKGLRAGKVVAAVNKKVQTHLVRSKTETELAGEHVTIIDADEFEEASRDPANRAFLQEARDYGEALKNRNFRLVEATPETAVLRAPSGVLFGISVDRGPDGEELNVTELEELPTSDQE